MSHADTIHHRIRATALELDAPLALASKRDGAWIPISHASLLERVRHLSLGLYGLGVRRGDRVAIISESRPEWTLVDLAALSIGAAIVPIYPTLTEDQVHHILSDSGARVCVVSDEDQLDKIRPHTATLTALERVITIDPPERDTDAAILTLDSVEATGRAHDTVDPGLGERLAAEVAEDDLATLIYTSGTTGRQKGVMLTHRNFTSNIDGSFFAGDVDLFTNEDVALSYLPLSHIFERTVVYGLLQCGAAIYFATSFDSVAKELREVRPTVSTSVPRLFEKMYQKIYDTGCAAGGLRTTLFKRSLVCGDAWARATNSGEVVNPLVELEYDLIANRLVFDKWRDAMGGRIRCFISGGAPLSRDIAYAFLGAGILILEGYGLTETSPVISVNRPGAHKIGTVGKPLDNVELKLAEDGEILVRGPSIMQGYYNLPEATADAFTEDRFFRTGDIGHLDEEGYLVITDRKKDLLKTSGGKYVAPQPIENALKASSLVSQAIVIGDRRKYCSALIVPNMDALEPLCRSKGIDVASREELLKDPRVLDIYHETVDRLTGNLARFEQIKKIALLPRELTIEAGEMTPTLKIKRRVVEERYRDVIESMYDEEAGAAVGGGAHA